MKCAACGYENKEADFVRHCFLSTQAIHGDEEGVLCTMDSEFVYVHICPECGTLKIKTRKDMGNATNTNI